MSRSSDVSTFQQFVTATATGRNMTKAAYVAVTCGVVAMVLLTVDPAYAGPAPCHRRAAVGLPRLFSCSNGWSGCVTLFASTGRWAYISSLPRHGGCGLRARGPYCPGSRRNAKSAWLLGMFWVLKVVPGIRGLRQLRRVLVVESGPLLSVLVIFLWCCSWLRWRSSFSSTMFSRRASAAYRRLCGGRWRP